MAIATTQTPTPTPTPTPRQAPASRPRRSAAISRIADVGAGLSLEERVARGKSLRKAVPLADHAAWTAAPEREDPVTILERQSAARLQELIPERYARMSESPFRFYRGAAALMAADLATTPVSGLRAQLCGDAHMLNFRLLASAERRLIFDINDFDETLPGPWEWDVKRLAASLVIAGRANGFGTRTRREIVLASVAAYRQWMRIFAAMRTLEVWHLKADMDDLHATVAQHLEKSGRKRLDDNLRAARRRDNLQAVKKMTTVRDGQLRIIADPPLLVPIEDLIDIDADGIKKRLFTLVGRYTRSLPADRRHLIDQYRVVDMARKVVGVGSVGTRCWIVLMVSRNDDDALLLQVKEASESVLAPFAGASAYSHQGERVVVGQRLMQASSDIFLGWVRTPGMDSLSRDFYVRQLRDWKGIAVPEQMVPTGMRGFGVVAGATLARAHAKSGDRVAIASYLGRTDSFERALAEFAESYADQNEADAQRLLDAISSGRVKAAVHPAPAATSR
jgi:uncharacterized protein (DUF2252 family)